MLVEIGQKHLSVTTKVSCFVIDLTSLVSKEDLKEQVSNHSTQELIQRFLLDGTQQRNCLQKIPRKSETQTVFLLDIASSLNSLKYRKILSEKIK